MAPRTTALALLLAASSACSAPTAPGPGDLGDRARLGWRYAEPAGTIDAPMLTFRRRDTGFPFSSPLPDAHILQARVRVGEREWVLPLASCPGSKDTPVDGASASCGSATFRLEASRGTARVLRDEVEHASIDLTTPWTAPLEPDRFWAHIDAVRAAAEDPEGWERALEQRLAAMDAPTRAAFIARWYALEDRAYDADVWAAAFLLQGGCSDDCFMDFRASLILEGREVFEAALADADSLADLPRPDQVGRLYHENYSYTFQRYPSPLKSTSGPPFDAAWDPTGAPWQEPDLPDRLPRLYQRSMSKFYKWSFAAPNASPPSLAFWSDPRRSGSSGLAVVAHQSGRRWEQHLQECRALTVDAATATCDDAAYTATLDGTRVVVHRRGQPFVSFDTQAPQPMATDRFQALVDEVRSAGETLAARTVALEKRLQMLSPEDLLGFDLRAASLCQHADSRRLRAAAVLVFGRHQGSPLCPLIFEGQDTWQALVDDPDTLADLLVAHPDRVRQATRYGVPVAAAFAERLPDGPAPLTGRQGAPAGAEPLRPIYSWDPPRYWPPAIEDGHPTPEEAAELLPRLANVVSESTAP